METATTHKAIEELVLKMTKLEFTESAVQRLNEVFEFVEANVDSQVWKELLVRLEYLNNYGGQNVKVVIRPDHWAPYCFSLEWFKDGKPWFNGGLILHAADPFTVTLDNSIWGIHT